MSIKLHVRHEPTIRAGIDISIAIGSAVEKYELTYGEIMRILSDCMCEWAGYQIKNERKAPTARRGGR